MVENIVSLLIQRQVICRTSSSVPCPVVLRIDSKHTRSPQVERYAKADQGDTPKKRVHSLHPSGSFLKANQLASRPTLHAFILLRDCHENAHLAEQ